MFAKFLCFWWRVFIIQLVTLVCIVYSLSGWLDPIPPKHTITWVVFAPPLLLSVCIFNVSAYINATICTTCIIYKTCLSSPIIVARSLPEVLLTLKCLICSFETGAFNVRFPIELRASYTSLSSNHIVNRIIQCLCLHFLPGKSIVYALLYDPRFCGGDVGS